MVKPVSQPVRRVRTPARGRRNSIAEDGLNMAQIRNAMVEQGETGPGSMAVDQPAPAPDMVVDARPGAGPGWVDAQARQVGAALGVGDSRPGGNEEDILPRIRPEVPQPVLGQEAGDMDGGGWGAIDRVGGWNSLLTEFNMLQEVPYQHDEVWVWAWGHVLQKLHTAEGAQDTNRALMWLMFLPQALLREAKRGGRQGRGLVAKWFNTLSRGDWGTLVELWERDKRAAEMRGHQPRQQRPDSEQQQQRMKIEEGCC